MHRYESKRSFINKYRLHWQIHHSDHNFHGLRHYYFPQWHLKTTISNYHSALLPIAIKWQDSHTETCTSILTSFWYEYLFLQFFIHLVSLYAPCLIVHMRCIPEVPFLCSWLHKFSTWGHYSATNYLNVPIFTPTSHTAVII